MKQNDALSNLRLFIVIMVVLHHAVLAYNSFFHFTDIYLLAGVIPISNLINPVVDSSKTEIANLINGLLDSFFMSTMFFISGIFVWKSLEKKGVKTFVIIRLKRLGIPFVVGVLLLIPLAYYPANMQYATMKGVDAVSFFEFWKQLASIGFLSGPFWFVLVLLVFNVSLAMIYLLVRKVTNHTIVKTPLLMKSSVLMVVVLILVSLISYLPMAKIFGADQWLGKGIINFQTARIIHYFTYFLAGTWLGVIGIEKTVLSQKKVYGLGWIGWIVLSIVLFFVLIGKPSISVATFSVLSATFTVGFIGLFMTYFNRKGLFSKLVPYSYSLYVIHYSVSSFVQYGLLKVDVSGFAKAVIAFIITTLFSMIIGMTVQLIKRNLKQLMGPKVMVE